MGTTYTVKIVDDTNISIIDTLIHSKIDSVLVSINQQMSTFIPTSEISIFNQSDILQIYPSNEFIEVLKYSKELSDISKGLFDITVGSLVQLWGFSKFNNDWLPPNENKIYQLLDNIGNDAWELVDGKLKKIKPHVQIDVNAIAKGLGVDAVSALITSFGFNNFMVEIGGEVYCSGINNKDIPWQIGIEFPQFNSRSLSRIANISDKAMATSGDYRNYFSHDGEIYSHVINPKSGKPIEHLLASATVISSTCMNADGIATALLVMGTHDALSFIENKSGVECFLIERDDSGEYKTFMSSGFVEFLSE
jgi:thiamine biosynthesis lipoprotein